jgi:hypothetical protein
LIDITVKVPEDRVAEFYSMFGRWLAEPGMLFASSVGEPDGEGVAWSRSDVEIAGVVWGKFSETAKALFSTLIDKPGSKFSGDELAQMLGIPNGKHGVAGVLAWPGRYCQAAGRTWPWTFEYPEGGSARYGMTEEIADIFRQARAT